MSIPAEPAEPGQPQDKPAVSFKTEADFLHAVGEKSRKAVSEAATKTRTELLQQLGVDNPDDVDVAKLAEMVKGSKRQVSDLERLQRDLVAKDKTLSEVSAELNQHREFKATVTKERAITAAASKDVAPEMMDMVAAFLLPKLAIDDKGHVVGADGTKPTDLIAALLKDRPQLKKDAFRPGAGTSSVPTVVPSSGGNGGGTTQKKSIGELVVAELKSKGIDPDKLLID